MESKYKDVVYPTKAEALKGKKAKYKEGKVITLESGRQYRVDSNGSFKRIGG